MAKAAAKAKKEITMEEALWKSADKLRGSVEPAEYKHVVLSLFFLKFASDKFEAQRKAIADGIADSLDTIKRSGVSTEEANKLFLFTQWTDMMSEFAKTGTSTVVLPSNFNEASSMFDQILAAGKVTERKGSEE